MKLLPKLLCLILCLGPTCHAAVYYVTPHSPLDCPASEHCHTINEYAQSDKFGQNDNIVLIFLDGTHNLTSLNLQIEQKESVVMILHHNANVTIQVQDEAQFILRNIKFVNLTGLRFISTRFDYTPWCVPDSDKTIHLAQVSVFSCQNSFFEQCSLAIENVETVNIEEINFSKSWIYYSISSNSTDEENLNKSVLIRESEFSLSTIAMLQTIPCNSSTEPNNINDNSIRFGIENCSLFDSFVTVQITTQSVLHLDVALKDTRVHSENGNAPSNLYGVTGLYVDISSNVTLRLEINNCEISGNSVGLALLANYSADLEVEIKQCQFLNNGGNFALVVAPKFGGIGLVLGLGTTANIKIDSTIISGNKFIQVYIYAGDIVTLSDTLDLEIATDSEHTVSSDNLTFEMTHSSIRDDLHGDNQLKIGLSVSAVSMQVRNCSFQNSAIEIGTHRAMFVNSNFTSAKQMGLFIRNANTSIDIQNCAFVKNNNIAIVIANTGQIISISQTIIRENNNGIVLLGQNYDTVLELRSCLFQENVGVSLGIIDLVFNTIPPISTATIDACNVTFYNNEHISSHQAGIVQVDASVHVLIGDLCNFENNRGSSIRAFTSNVSLQGSVTFQNNTAYQGAAISLTSSMLILGGTDTVIVFRNNSAEYVGGSIHIDHPVYTDSKSGSACFYKLPTATIKKLAHFEINISLVFNNNTAKYGGYDIYGATVDSNCVVNLDQELDHQNHSVNIQERIFKFDRDATCSIKLSSTTTDPRRICLCNNAERIVCANLTSIFYDIEQYPGETFHIPLIVVGLGFGAVYGTMYARLLPTTNNTGSLLGDNQHVKDINHTKCNSIPFKVYSEQPAETIVLAVNNTPINQPGNTSAINSSINDFSQYKVIPITLSTVPVYINLKLLKCPAGFQLINSSCNCSDILQDIGVNECHISENKAYIKRSRNTWVKPVFNPDGIIGSMYCPFNYCDKGSKLNLNDSNSQCSLDRIGILCGGCPSNFSLVIGSSRCLPCSDNYGMLLVLAFAVMGIVLVFFIKILDLTVTTGTINGLLFYANIVWANQSVLFPPQNETSTLLMVLKVFMAWLNLDFGIETCFIEHLDGYWKTWLQFAFPIYIWSLAGLIIVASHYSTKITQFLGKWENVLASLFLIAYAKLLRTIFVVLEFTILVAPNSNKLVWSFDGNVAYFGLKHGVLFAVALAILLFLWLPYTIVLLFVQTFRKYSDRKFLGWVNRLKPMFDSYLGPLKNDHQYWVGLCLLTRLVLLVVTSILLPYITAVLIIIVSSILCVFASTVYNKLLPTILDGCFLVNLVLLSSGAVFIEAHRGISKDLLACISVGFAFSLFLCIMGYHIWVRAKLLKIKQRNGSNADGYQDLDRLTPLAQSRSITYQEVSVPRLREPLLEFNI